MHRFEWRPSDRSSNWLTELADGSQCTGSAAAVAANILWHNCKPNYLPTKLVAVVTLNSSVRRTNTNMASKPVDTTAMSSLDC